MEEKENRVNQSANENSSVKEGVEEVNGKDADSQNKEESSNKDAQIKEEKPEESEKKSKYPVPGYSDEDNMW